MAGMICKTSPSVVLSLALRSIRSISTALNRTISASRRDGSLIQSQSFSCAAPSKDLVDAHLCKFLKHEIKSDKFNINNSQVNTLPHSFPYKIIEDKKKNDYPRNLILERKCILEGVETITLKIDMADVGMKEIESYDCPESDEEILMMVEVEKPGTDDHLHFEIIASTKDINIQSFYITSKDKRIHYPKDTQGLEGPEFKELDDELQRSLYKYLEIRGINSDTVSFLLEYIAVENRKNYFQAMKDLEKYFIK